MSQAVGLLEIIYPRSFAGKFRIVSPAICAALRLWFLFLYVLEPTELTSQITRSAFGVFVLIRDK